jgi:hypothetical protein
MSKATKPRYSKEEFARRGDEIYDRDVMPNVGPDDEGKYAVIDIETGAFEVDRDETRAFERLLVRQPEAQIWLRQVGSRYARRFGPRHQAAPE